MTISLVLVLEADTVWTAGDRVQGATPVPPMAEALEALAGIAHEFEEFGPAQVFCNDQEPGTGSGMAIAEPLDLPVNKTALLKPLDMGAWEGLRRLEIKEQYGKVYRRWKGNPENYTAPGGEALGSLEERLVALVERIREQENSAVITGSADVMCVLCALVLPRYGADVSAGGELPPNAGLWQMFDFEQRWMAWDLLLDDEG